MYDMDAVTVRNKNTIGDTVITIIALVPIIPGGLLLLLRYLKKVSISYNKYYNFNNHRNRIKTLYGIKIFKR